MRISGILTLILFSTLLFSCRPQRATYNYLEDVTDSTFQENVYIAESKIQQSDQLSVRIYSASVEPAIDALYNLPVQQSSGGQNSQQQGFLVDVRGNIE
jgi:hypothetical protein